MGVSHFCSGSDRGRAPGCLKGAWFGGNGPLLRFLLPSFQTGVARQISFSSGHSSLGLQRMVREMGSFGYGDRPRDCLGNCLPVSFSYRHTNKLDAAFGLDSCRSVYRQARSPHSSGNLPSCLVCSCTAHEFVRPEAAPERPRAFDSGFWCSHVSCLVYVRKHGVWPYHTEHRGCKGREIHIVRKNLGGAR